MKENQTDSEPRAEWLRSIPEKSKHTPGPWTITPSSHDREWSHWIESGTASQRRLVCAIGTDNLRSGSNEVNAQLIAAAPELLEACKRLVAASQIPNLRDLPDARIDAIIAIRLAERGAS